MKVTAEQFGLKSSVSPSLNAQSGDLRIWLNSLHKFWAASVGERGLTQKSQIVLAVRLPRSTSFAAWII